jgi:transposase-like protein
MTEKFDFEQALADLKAGKPITGKDSVLGPLVKQLTEAALEAEIDTHLAQEVAPNRKNGKSRKTMKSTSGEFELETPRDRAGTFVRPRVPMAIPDAVNQRWSRYGQTPFPPV